MQNLISDARIGNPALGPNLQGYLNNDGSISFFSKLIPKGIGLCFVAGVLIFFFVFISGAIGWITSGGDKQGLEASKSKLTNGIIGLVLLFAFFAVAKLIESFFGFDVMSLDIAGLKI